MITTSDIASARGSAYRMPSIPVPASDFSNRYGNNNAKGEKQEISSDIYAAERVAKPCRKMLKMVE